MASNPANAVPPATTPPAADQRPEPPADNQRADALARIKEIFGDDYKDASPTGKTALAAKLIRQADDAGNSPVERYVLLDEGAAMAAAGGDMAAAAAALTTLGKRFKVEVEPLKIKLAEQAIKQAVTNQQRTTLLTQLQTLAEAEVQQQHYSAADNWYELAQELAKTTKNLKIAKQLRQAATELKELAKRSEEADDARKQLATNPTAAEAHLVLGKFLCFARDDWRGRLAAFDPIGRQEPERGGPARLANINGLGQIKWLPAMPGSCWASAALTLRPIATRCISEPAFGIPRRFRNSAAKRNCACKRG